MSGMLWAITLSIITWSCWSRWASSPSPNGTGLARRVERFYDIRPSRCSPTRMALAMAVRAGFTAPMLGKKLVSTT
jgi:hypothetical protein